MPRFAALPDPALAASLDDLIERLRMLKVWAGNPSYETIKERINKAWTSSGRPAGDMTHKPTVASCFRSGRKRLNNDLVLAVVHALHPDGGYVNQWRGALRVISGEIEAVSQVRVHGYLPPDLAEFTGRTRELNHLHDGLRRATRAGDTVVISAIEGMAGVGKTELAVHAAHLLHRQAPFECVLFVNLRGYHADTARPSADPAAVLDGFLRLLGVPGHQIPHDLAARAAAYRDKLANTRTLVFLDNAAGVEQVRPLLPVRPGCLALVTSRRSLTGLDRVTRVAVDVFTPDEAVTFLNSATAGAPVGPDASAPARIARRCGHLPLALSLITGHIRNMPGWTLTDHADRLDERHEARRLDAGIELALDLSYQHLAAGQQRLLRMVALHPGQDFDACAAAALSGADLATTETWLNDLHLDHLLRRAAPGRYAFHDLVRAYAVTRAHDHDRPSDRRAALTRLFDHYLATAAAAMNALDPAGSHRRPQIPPAGTPSPCLTDANTASAWLDTERPTLVAVAAHTSSHGWPGHTTRLAHVLYRYLQGGYHTDALAVHAHAQQAAGCNGDSVGQAHALIDLGVARMRQGKVNDAGDRFHEALAIFRRASNRIGEARALNNLGFLTEQKGLLPQSRTYYRQALVLARLGRHQGAEAFALAGLGVLDVRSGDYESAGGHLREALTLCRRLGYRSGEASALDGLGQLHLRLGEPDRATGLHQQALTIFREIGDQDAEVWVLNGLGEAAHAAGRTTDALTHHSAARIIATDIGAHGQQARAHAGLGRVHHALGDPVQARDHYHRALIHFNDLGLPEAEQIRAVLADLDFVSAQLIGGIRIRGSRRAAAS